MCVKTRQTLRVNRKKNLRLFRSWYVSPVIAHFATQAAADIFNGKPVKRVPVAVQEQALRKLQLLHAAPAIAVLQAVPGLHCKKLGGQRKNQPELWSVRVNNQWRITFTCTEPPLELRNVDFTDYH